MNNPISSLPVLIARNLQRNFTLAGNKTLAVLQGLDLEIHESEMVAIRGLSGVGKSTLLHCIGLLDTPTCG
ncbi:MAG TPA: ATP-binding cassette domain-containing protein, partial [Planctomycetes bacterium]|nr:ATP-binding cassette domain-containing protein [Planctomycetota bacterium]